jgi:predicted GNAT family acetyltransferase
VKPLLCRTERRDHELFFCVCRELHAEVPLDELPRVRIATPDDAEDVARLLLSIEEFGRVEYSGFADEIAQGQKRITLIRDEGSGRVISTANAVAESDAAAMIIGVATLASERGKGYASVCVYRLVKDLADRGKSACLFFSNPAAGRIYHRLGFRNIGMWRMLHFDEVTTPTEGKGEP